MRGLKDKRVLITGGASGIGAATAARFLEEGSAVVVLDRGLHIRIWSEKAQDFWGVRGDEVRGHGFLDLDIGLPVEELRQVLRDTLVDGRDREQSLDGVNRRGKQIRCRVRVAPYLEPAGVAGLILLIEETEPG